MSVRGRHRKKHRVSRRDSVPAFIAKCQSVWQTNTLRWGILSAVAVWLAFPPVGCWPLAWLAPYGWIRLIQTPQLDGRRPFATLYLVGYAHWLLMTYWVTLPHWSAAIGWFFLAAYLAIYVIGFVWLARRLVHVAGWPSFLAAPLAWVAMEMARSYLFTGFALLPISHSQVEFVPILQIASYTGAYGVSFLIVLGAATIEHAVTSYSKGWRQSAWWALGMTVSVLGATLAYGYWTLSNPLPPKSQTKVAIVQGSYDTIFDTDQGRSLERSDFAFQNYCQLTFDATRRGDIDLVVWPESMFGRFYFVEDFDQESSEFDGPDNVAVERKRLIRQFGTNCLMGTGTMRYQGGRSEQYNTAAFFDASGEVVDTYHKMHPVMFGEYVPLATVFPILNRLSPNGGGLTAGTEPKLMQVGDVSFSPNICFENTVPHLISQQINQLERDRRVDALVTLTNDGWFWGSSLLDVHLACGVLRAVENRKPAIIAANTGFSAYISPMGRILAKGPRRDSKVIVADLSTTSAPQTVYTRVGDGFAFACVALCGLGVVTTFVNPSRVGSAGNG